MDFDPFLAVAKPSAARPRFKSSRTADARLAAAYICYTSVTEKLIGSVTIRVPRRVPVRVGNKRNRYDNDIKLTGTGGGRSRS
jgi:hypothetical protein